MKKNVSPKRPRETETIAMSLYKFCRFMTDALISIYMLLILVVMPFYYTEGHLYIGTDKSRFFRYWSMNIGRVLAVTLICYLITALMVLYQNHRKTWRSYLTASKLWELAKQTFNLTDVFVGAYGISLILSYGFSSYKEDALWGAGGWYMGLVTQLTLVSVYFLIAKLWKLKKIILLSVLPTSLAVFTLGVLNRFDIYPLDMMSNNPQYISTIGNINWYCGYLVSVFFGAFCLFWQMGVLEKSQKNIQQYTQMSARKKQYALIKAALGIYLAMGFATMVTHGSSSGIFTMAVLLFVFFCLSAPRGREMQNFWAGASILSIVCLALFFLRRILPQEITYLETTTELLTNSALPFIMTVVSITCFAGTVMLNRRGIYPVKGLSLAAKALTAVSLMSIGLLVILITINTLFPDTVTVLSDKSLFTFSPTWGSNRGATWSAGVLCFGEQNLLHKLVGVGPDSMSAFLYSDGSAGLLSIVTERFGTDRLTNAHNEWLTILVNTGVLGCISYAGIIISTIYRGIRNRKQDVIGAVCAFCVLAYTVNNIFSFQQSLNAITIFIILGVGSKWRAEKPE